MVSFLRGFGERLALPPSFLCSYDAWGFHPPTRSFFFFLRACLFEIVQVALLNLGFFPCVQRFSIPP